MLIIKPNKDTINVSIINNFNSEVPVFGWSSSTLFSSFELFSSVEFSIIFAESWVFLFEFSFANTYVLKWLVVNVAYVMPFSIVLFSSYFVFSPFSEILKTFNVLKSISSSTGIEIFTLLLGCILLSLYLYSYIIYL